MEQNLSYEGYRLVWEERFEGETLNPENWNIELRQPGWVNNELQEYTASPENIYIKDGKLVLKPVKRVDEDGKVSYTCGRVNTEGKHEFTYGIFEARAKVPDGKGFLPAFWLMTSDEQKYGQWPRCGEIDIMEVLGHDTKVNYGTLHYGIPHRQSQGSVALEQGSLSDGFHVYGLKWEEGKISWYVDGKLFYSTSDWYCAREELGSIAFPAPFNHPFFIILNLAVGGAWPGDPDETTDIDSAAYEIDFVRVYQK